MSEEEMMAREMEPDFSVEHSRQFEKFAEALALAQLEIEGADKDNQNPHFKSKYATLASVWDACHGPLNRQGIAILQVPGANAGGTSVLYTWLIHKSGQWFRGEWKIKPTQDTPQGVGSAVTYARRYSLAAMTGVAPKDDDDDGNSASAREPERKGGWKQLDDVPQEQSKPERAVPAEFGQVRDDTDSMPADIANVRRELQPFAGKKFTDLPEADVAAIGRSVEEMAQKTKSQNNRATLTVLAAIIRNDLAKRKAQ